MALNAGEVEFDDHGATSASVNLTFRLLEAPPLRKALAESRDVLALIVSPWFFDDVVRHSAETDAATFRPAHFSVKETTTTGWISLPGHPYPPDPKVLTPEPVHRWTAPRLGIALFIAAALFVAGGAGLPALMNNELPSPAIPNVFCLADGETAAWQNHHSKLRLAASVNRLDENVFVADLPQSSPSVTFTARLGTGSRPDDCALQLTTQNALCLTVPTDTDSDVIQAECTGSAAQQWLIENHWHHEGVMWERLRPARNPDLCLAIAGKNAVVHECSTEWNQQWQRS
ncbi:hypothetical protein JOF56_005007 [Kibdelosporangium banguiense]|uniref:Ricin B lectin domain-containing protein n=1 Tax=Kibdelosporangium banguiense TaxID=1365924 RepID=A0ABS4TJN6_9PSEU|nr:RICIN domain-containing protein [Kibdelosporangium banguiense]MBP2324622.1 hypothetical protein [Kibdelosporangium banguiense]